MSPCMQKKKTKHNPRSWGCQAVSPCQSILEIKPVPIFQVLFGRTDLTKFAEMSVFYHWFKHWISGDESCEKQKHFSRKQASLLQELSLLVSRLKIQYRASNKKKIATNSRCREEFGLKITCYMSQLQVFGHKFYAFFGELTCFDTENISFQKLLKQQSHAESFMAADDFTNKLFTRCPGHVEVHGNSPGRLTTQVFIVLLFGSQAATLTSAGWTMFPVPRLWNDEWFI